MNAIDLRTKTVEQLKEDLLSLRKEQFNFRFQLSTGQLEGTGRIRIVRRNIARIKTVLTEAKKSDVKVAAKKAAAPKKAATKTVAKKKKES